MMQVWNLTEEARPFNERFRALALAHQLEAQQRALFRSQGRDRGTPPKNRNPAHGRRYWKEVRTAQGSIISRINNKRVFK
jgi:hypothetical protein